MLKDVLARLEKMGNETMRARNAAHGAGANQYGVMLGDIRKIAKDIKANQPFAMELWQTGNLDARLLAILLMTPKKMTAAEVDALVRSNNLVPVSDWLNAYVVKQHPDRESLRQQYMQTDHVFAARAGWSLTAERVAKAPEGLDLDALLGRIAAEMPDAPPEVQWTMNTTLAQIGIHHPAYRDRALALGEAMGIYRDYPVSKGCTSPFAPIWINEMVSRQT